MLLARAGIDVVLIDRAAFPRAKACGDCISPGANSLLARLGLWNNIVSRPHALLTGWQLSAGADASFSARFHQTTSDTTAHTALSIERRHLDHALLMAAQQAGARLLAPCRVTDVLHATGNQVLGVRTDHGDLNARIVVGADGLRSRVARILRAHARAPRLRKLSLTAHVRGVSGMSTLGEMHVAGDVCLGIAPVESSADPLCNVTVVLTQDSVPGTTAPAMMRAALNRFPARDLSHLIDPDETILASGPFDWPTRGVVFGNVALVGDAAGYYDPFTGQGIYQAMAGAELLAAAIIEALRTPLQMDAALARYAKAHARLIRPARTVQQTIEFVCRHERLSRPVFRALHRSPDVAARLVGVTGDVLPASTLHSPALLARLLAAATLSNIT
jgi:flavin-dependent dehydrogenase